MELVSYNMLGLYTSVISTMSTNIFGACKVVSVIIHHKNPDVNIILNRLDINCKLQTIECLLSTLGFLNEQLPEDFYPITNPDEKKNPIELSLFFLNDIINTIHQDLDRLNGKVTRHHNKWFNTWRTLNISKETTKLEDDCTILDQRFKRFIKVCEIYNLLIH